MFQQDGKMAATPPIIANTDFNQWQTWTPVKDPNTDRTYYVIPGYGNRYVYDPFESNATGRIQLYDNPQPFYDTAERVRKEQEEATSPMAQLAGPLGAIGGVYAGKKVSDLIAGTGAVAKEAGVQAGLSKTAEVGASKLGAPQIFGASRVGASQAGAAPANSFMSGIGAPAAGALGAAALGASMYNYGGRKVLQGEAEPGDVLNTALQSNPITGWMNPALDVLGLGTVGSILGLNRKTTKQKQKERAAALANKDESFANVLSIASNNADEIRSAQEAAAAQTPGDYKGWFELEGLGPVWVNKQAPQEGFQHNQEYFETLGSGDVLHMPWLYENVEGYGQKPLEEQIKIADAALQFGNPKGNAGNIDFSMTPEFKAAIGLEDLSDELVKKMDGEPLGEGERSKYPWEK